MVCSNVSVPLFAVGFVSVVVGFELVVEVAVTAGSTFGDSFCRGWAIVFGKLSGFLSVVGNGVPLGISAIYFFFH